MKKRCNKQLDRMSKEIKDMVCDNCVNSDSCDWAYKHVFKYDICHEVFENLKEEIDIEEYEN